MCGAGGRTFHTGSARLNDPREQFNLAEIATRGSIGYNITDIKLDLLSEEGQMASAMRERMNPVLHDPMTGRPPGIYVDTTNKQVQPPLPSMLTPLTIHADPPYHPC
eukprot:791196-Prorocentrum_minimum.AAC.1